MKKIVEYYKNYDEDGRLVRDPAHQMEFITTTHLLDSLLQPGDRILDVGAGTGRYAFYFAEKGYDVTAVDLVPENVEMMKDKLVDRKDQLNLRIGQADARNLSHYSEESYDLVLCLGPIYHLWEKEDQEQCIQEALRVLKPGGMLGIAYINKFAAYVNTIRVEGEIEPAQCFNNILEHGYFYGDERDCFYFTSPGEVEELVMKFPVEKVTHVATDGIGYLMSNLVNNLSEKDLQVWVENHLKHCQEPSILGFSMHGLIICRKR